MAGLRVFLVVHAAARDNQDIRAFSDIEVVVNQIVHAAVGDAGRDVDRFPFCAGQHMDHKAGAFLFGLDFDMLT